MNPFSRCPRGARFRRRTGRWWAAACFLLLSISFSVRHRGQPDPAADPGVWRLTLPEAPTFPPVWTIPEAPGARPPVRPPEADAVTAAELRARLAASVKNGRLLSVPSGGVERTATFRPWRRGEPGAAGNADNSLLPAFPESPKPPGPLEDAALAAAIRSRVAADPELGKRNVVVTCQAGGVTLRTTSGQGIGGGLSLESTAALADLALAVEPTVTVQVDLPELPAGGSP